MLRHLVDITDGPGDDELWDPIIKRLLPGMVDMLVKVDQGKLKLNTIHAEVSLHFSVVVVHDYRPIRNIRLLRGI